MDIDLKNPQPICIYILDIICEFVVYNSLFAPRQVNMYLKKYTGKLLDAAFNKRLLL